jgi:hypothetical protein
MNDNNNAILQAGGWRMSRAACVHPTEAYLLQVFKIISSLFHLFLFSHLVVVVRQYFGRHIASIRDYRLRYIFTEKVG